MMRLASTAEIASEKNIELSTFADFVVHSNLILNYYGDKIRIEWIAWMANVDLY